MAKKVNAETDISTEEKIKEAARKVFTKKGYAATRTRDIADEAGLNLALLNYYFRSKEKLFEIIMFEKIQQFFGVMDPILNNAESKLEDKVELIAFNYIDLLTKNPDLPLFVLSGIRNGPPHIEKMMGRADKLIKSVLIKQIQEKIPGRNPLHFLFNILGLCVYPFVMNPILQSMSVMNDKMFSQMMKERKTLIPVWIEAMLEVT